MLTYFRILLMLMLLSVLFMPVSTHAQGEEAVVYGVFFYSPRCGHCHEVLTNHWPQIETEFGSQLQVIFIDVTTQDGATLMRTATDAMQINSNAVPMLIIGETVLIGSVDIPEQTPPLVRTGLQNGGIGIPPFPGSAQLFAQAGIVLAEGAENSGDIAGVSTTAPAIATNDSIFDKLNSDPLANTGAIVVLLGLLASLVVIGRSAWAVRAKSAQRVVSAQTQHWIIIGLAIFAAFLAITLFAAENDNGLVTLIALVELVAFVVIAAVVGKLQVREAVPEWLFPIVILAGLGVAGYLTYVETTTTEAVCGTIGHCNTVQESDYASILGIPIGVLGLLGYGSILGLWLWQRIQPNELADLGLLGLASFGVLFSAYLTFLEPFVIGATCVWCLTSAVTMLIILWMVAPRGYEALQHLNRKTASTRT